MKSLNFLALFSVVEGLAIRSDSPYKYIPLYYDYGTVEKVAANLTFGTSENATATKVVIDTGSSGFWIWRSGAVVNYGGEILGTQGPCNVTVSNAYNPALSSNSVLTNESAEYSYASASKIIYANEFGNDTLTAEGGNGAIPKVQAGLADFALVRQNIDQCTGVEYDLGILGLGGLGTGSPSFREGLFSTGQISSKTVVTWFDKLTGPPGKITGGALFGAIDRSKYRGSLVQVPSLGDALSGAFYTSKPLIKFNGHTFNGSIEGDCLVDSGSSADEIPLNFGDETTAFFNQSGGSLISYEGSAAYNGSCDDIPTNLTLGLAFPSVDQGSITIQVPIKNYARGTPLFNSSDAGKVCPLNLRTSGCTFAAPFFSAALVAANDEDNSLAFAQAGVSKTGSGLDLSQLEVFKLGNGFSV